MMHATRLSSVGLIATLLSALLACGSPSATEAITVAISPSSASVQAGATQAFTASVTGATNTSVSWSVAEGSSGGAVTSSGVYTAPSAPGSYHVVAASEAKPSATATAVVTVNAIPPPPPVTSVAVTPASATITAGATQLFAAQVNGSASAAVM